MSTSQEKLQRFKLRAQIGATIAVPLVLAIVGWLVQRTVSEAGLKKDYVQMALGLLQQKPSEDTKELREWAIAVLDKHSPVPIPDELKRQLVKRQLEARQASLPGMAPMSALEGQTNRQGNDLGGTGFQVNGPEECSDLCSKDARCEAMTFVKHATLHGGICWLKNPAPPPTLNGAMTSAIKLNVESADAEASK